LGAAAALVLCASISANAQQVTGTAAQPNEHPGADAVKFLSGAGAAFLAHEGGHLLFDVIFAADPYVKSVRFGPVPFFAVSHHEISPRREFTVSSAGFWTQEATSEWLLTRHPGLRDEHAPFAKGALAFDVLTSIGYGSVAMFKAGPPERDTRGMAESIGVDERIVGALVMAPALLDAYRYVRPGSRWAPWASRAVKAGSVLLVLRQTSSGHR
jgi:hypothetical protein